MNLEFLFHMPTKIIFGRGNLEKIGEEAKSLGKHALLVTGRKFARKYGYIDRIKALLEKENIKVSIFDRVEPNPSFETVNEGGELARKENIDMVIAFGGGSAMDAGKGIAVLCAQGGKIEEYVYPSIVKGEVIPIIAIPTTCGTGSEVTRYAVLTDTKRRKKLTVVGYPIIPKVAIVDPEVLEHLPKNLTAYTAFDALSHALEAYWSRASQPISDLLALESIRLIVTHIREGYEEPKKRDVLHYASLLAGMAINAAGTTMVHGVGYYLTAHHNIHHGLANALFLPFALKFNAPTIKNKLLRLAKYLEIEVSNYEDAASKLFKAICELEDVLGIPKGLKELGIEESEIDDIVRDALEYERNMKNNPRPISEEDLKNIVLETYRGRP